MGESTELTTKEQSALEAAGARVDETSLTFTNPALLRWEHFEGLAMYFLGPIGRGYPWWVGDMLNMAEDILGEEFSQLEHLLPHSPQTCANYKSVAKLIPKSRRRGLHLSVAAPAASLEPRVRDQLIDKAVKEAWTREEMREARRDLGQEGERVSVLPPPKKVCPACGVILED